MALGLGLGLSDFDVGIAKTSPATGIVREDQAFSWPLPTFYAPLTISLIPYTAQGSAVPTYSRATAAYVQDHEGVLRLAQANEARFWGARRVQNYVSNSTTVSTQTPTVTAGTYTLSFYGTGSITYSGAATGTLNGTGASTRVSATFATTAGGLTLTVTGSVTQGQLEDVTGQSVQTPSEYVSTNVLSAPYQGANVDGVQYFDTVRLHTQNLMRYSSGAIFSGTSGTDGVGSVTNTENTTDVAAPDGTFSALKAVITAALHLDAVIYDPAYPPNQQVIGGAQYEFSFYARLPTSGAPADVKYSIVDNTSTTTIVAPTSYISQISSSNWARVTVPFTTFGTTTAVQLGFLRDGGSTGTIYIWGCQLRRATPSYLNTYAATSGAAVGPTDTGTTAPIPSTTLLRFLTEFDGDQKISSTGAIRDLNHADWTKTNFNAATTATGVDGVMNACKRCSATAAFATAMQPATALVLNGWFFSAYIRRVTGTGAIDMTKDGGATWTTVMSGAGTGQWVRCVLSPFMAAPQVGFRIQTSGDVVDIDFTQLESQVASPVPTTPIAVAGLSRNSDNLSYPNTGNLSDAAGTLYFESAAYGLSDQRNGGTTGGVDGSPREILLATGGGGNTTAMTTDTTPTTLTATGVGLWQANTRKRQAVAWGAGTKSISQTGSAVVSGAYSTFSSNVIRLGSSASFSSHSSGCMSNLRIYSQKMTDAQLTAMVA